MTIPNVPHVIPGYIPFVVGAAFVVAMAGMMVGSGESLAAAAIILSSPALFAGESVAGAVQCVTGKEASLSNLGDGKSIFKKAPKQEISPPKQKTHEVVKGKVIEVRSPHTPYIQLKPQERRH